MAPEILDVHILLNPIKDVELTPLLTNDPGTPLETVTANDERCSIRDADTSEKETKKDIASQEDVLDVAWKVSGE